MKKMKTNLFSKAKSEWKKLCLFVLMLFAANLVFADNNELMKGGSVKGTIMDANGTLPGASIMVKGTLNGTFSDFNGDFQLSNIAEGTQTLLIHFLGYEDKEISVEIVKNTIAQLGKIIIEPAASDIDEVLVKGTFYPSQIRAMSMKKASLGIMEVIASDAIGKLPDRNAAEAVQRISGVSIERDQGEGRYVIVRGTPLSWNATLLNGNRMPSSAGTSDDASGRTSPLDIFPSEMIQYVQLSKALTPDIEGDAIGGSVNFITKTAPPKRTFNVNVGYGYNNQAQKPIQSLSLLYGDRSKNGKFGFLVSGSYWNRNWGTDNYEVNYIDESYALESLELRDYLGRRRTYGINAGLEYNFTNNSRVFARGVYTDFQDDETAIEHIYGFADSNFSLRRRRGIIGINLYGGELGGKHSTKNGKSIIDWKLATYATDMGSRKVPNSKADNAAYEMATFSMGMTYGGLTSDGYKYLDIDSPSGYTGDAFDDIQPRTETDITSDALGIDNVMGYDMTSFEKDITGQLDYTYNLSDKIKLKAGYKYRNKYLERATKLYYSMYLGGYYGQSMPMSDYQTQAFPENGGYLTEIGEPYKGQLSEAITVEQLDELYAMDKSGTFMDTYPLWYNMVGDETNASYAPGIFSGYEITNAAYLMGEFDIAENLKLIGGARYENIGIEFEGYSVITDAAGETSIVKSNDKSSYDAFLPMVHLKYSPNDRLNLRAAYTKTYARPNFEDVNPTQTINNITYQISQGNIDLKPTFSNNFDVMGEYFFSNVGFVTGGIFYKDLSNVIYTNRQFQNIDGTTYEVSLPKNSDNGWLYGFEVGLSRRFTNLPGFLGGFGVEANYTYTDSEMEVPSYVDDEDGEIIEVITKQSLPNQSKNIFNASVFYDKDAFSLRVAGNYKGEALVYFANQAKYNRWYDSNFTVDVTAAYNITKRLKLYVELNNLTNEPLRYNMGKVSERPEQTEYYDMRGMIGINFSL